MGWFIVHSHNRCRQQATDACKLDPTSDPSTRITGDNVGGLHEILVNNEEKRPEPQPHPYFIFYLLIGSKKGVREIYDVHPSQGRITLKSLAYF